MKAAFVQTSPVFGEIRRNVDAAVRRINRLDAGLIVLPELFSTGYQFRSRAEALSLAEDPATGYAATRLIEAAAEKRAFIVAGIAERSSKRVYNSSILVGPRGLVGLYRKTHLFSNEKKIFAPGDTGFEVFRAGRLRLGMMICFDWVFPEAARTLSLKGADIICHPSNLVLPHCPRAMITRSIENRVWSITANRVGVEERIRGRPLRFIGSSQIVAPDGELLCRAGGSRAASGVAEIDPARARDKKITSVNDLFRDRRREFFEL